MDTASPPSGDLPPAPSGEIPPASSGEIPPASSGDLPPPSILKTVRVEIKGRVQGVGFRDWTMENAEDLGLCGWVRNRRNGSVEALFSGSPQKVQEMVDRRCRIGPPAAAVTAVASFPSNDDPGLDFHCKNTL